MPSTVVRILRKVLIGLAALVVLALVALYGLSQRIIAREYDLPAETLVVPDDPASIAEGERLATLLGCSGGCHGESGLEGSHFVDEFLLAHITAPNLTRIVLEYTDAELERVIRHGVKNDGRSVFIMPSYMFAGLSDEDLGRVIAYLRSQPEVEGPGRRFSVGPVGRAGLVLGQFGPLAPEISPATHFTAAPPSDGTLARGRYLGHTVCTECHGQDLRGGEGFTPDLSVVAAYSLDEFRTLMRTGVPASGAELDLMRAVALGRFTRFTDAEVVDLYEYLRTLPMGADAPDGVFAERAAVYLQGSSEMIAEALRARSADEAAVVGDDLMFYRAVSRELLEQAGWPIVTMEGRPRLGFVVEGETVVPDLGAHSTLDLVILYEPGAEPRFVTPIEIVGEPESFGARGEEG
jgi:mono/diheme cytochrome c family protein